MIVRGIGYHASKKGSDDGPDSENAQPSDDIDFPLLVLQAAQEIISRMKQRLTKSPSSRKDD